MSTDQHAHEQPQRSEYFDELRHRMVQHQLRSRGIADERVLRAMRAVPREEFVTESVRDYAYDDCPLPIGFGQTISQPFTVAFQCEALQLQGDQRVLEIGTGSGYAAAVLSHLAREVYTVERIPGLAAPAKETLARLATRMFTFSRPTERWACPSMHRSMELWLRRGAHHFPSPSWSNSRWADAL